jgi:hypothetical protein
LPNPIGEAFKLTGVIGPQKLGIDPTLQTIALYLNPVPITFRNFESVAFGSCPNNEPVCRTAQLREAPRLTAPLITGSMRAVGYGSCHPSG